MISFALDSQELAEKYDVIGRRQFEHGKGLIADLGIRAGKRVLDIGAGTGLLTRYVAELVAPTGSVIGIDPLAMRIEVARKKAHPALEMRVGQAEDLSAFAHNEFDVVYLNSVFHWLADKPAVLRQIARVLKSNGLIGLSSATEDRPHSLDLVRARALDKSGLSGRVPPSTGILKVTSDDLHLLLESNGFRVRQLVIRTFTDHFRDVDEVLDFNRSSSFGNDQASLTDEERARFRDALAEELELSRTAAGIVQQRHLLFAVAEKLAD